MGKQKKTQASRKEPAWMTAKALLHATPLDDFADYAHICCYDGYPMAKEDWAYVMSNSYIFLNPHRKASPAEWVYVISHCLLHLGMGHFREDRMNDPLWHMACDWAVTRFLKESHIGTPPPEFQGEPPIPVRDEEQAWEQLRAHPELAAPGLFSTMTHGRPDMVWEPRVSRQVAFTVLFAKSLQETIRRELERSSGQAQGQTQPRHDTPYHRAKSWFLSSYPLLGALAASFRIVDDYAAVRRMDIPVAAVSAQLGELYINPHCQLGEAEWRFVLAHEFLHVALRHDARLEDRDPILWNVACDFVVNGWLVEMNVGEMPESALYDLKFQGMNVETVYDAICQDIRFYTKQDPRDLLYGGDWWDSLESGEVDERYRAALQQGLAYHESRFRRGYLPEDLVEEIRAVNRPPIRWDVELAKWFDERFSPLEKHRTYARLSRRQSATPDIPRPAWHMETDPTVQRIFGVLLDTSGSMDRHLLAAALGSIASYAQSRDVHHVRVVFCDAAAYDQGVMAPEDIAGTVRVRGRGGTVLQPGIDLLAADPSFPKDAPLLIITDGDCDRLRVSGRDHAYLIPYGRRLPFPPKGPVFKMK